MNISKIILNTLQNPLKLSVRYRTNPNSRKLVPYQFKVVKPKTRIIFEHTKTADDIKRESLIPTEFRLMYPEFLPDPTIQWRNVTREKLERLDMLKRRVHIDIPEFYVGTIMAVTSSDSHAAGGKIVRFLGICIDRDRCGLRARFILRNIVDHQGVEVQYEMYDPTIQKIEIIRLEKRLDDHLYYLRDALPEYSTFDLNMEPEILPEGTAIPINSLRVTLKPRPWLEKWERQQLKGIANMDEHLNDRRRQKAKASERPWEKYDLVKEYRQMIPEEEQKEIYSEVYGDLHQLEMQRKKLKRKRVFTKPVKLA